MITSVSTLNDYSNDPAPKKTLFHHLIDELVQQQLIMLWHQDREFKKNKHFIRQSELLSFSLATLLVHLRSSTMKYD